MDISIYNSHWDNFSYNNIFNKLIMQTDEKHKELEEISSYIYDKYVHLYRNLEHWDQWDDKREVAAIGKLISDWATKYSNTMHDWISLSSKMPPISKELNDRTVFVLFKYGVQYHTGSCSISTRAVRLDNGWEFNPDDPEYKELFWRPIQ